VQGYLLPDEGAALKALLTDLALTQRYDVVFTTGGTGLGPRDVTPEATLAVIEKRLHGFEQAMMAASLCKTPHAVISRAVAGTLGTCIIINMPGSRKAVLENMQAVLPALAHASAKLRGDKADCGT
jgi:molybdenum cofactor synthesis domain-containing protein